jgi:hypothetical protein
MIFRDNFVPQVILSQLEVAGLEAEVEEYIHTLQHQRGEPVELPYVCHVFYLLVCYL